MYGNKLPLVQIREYDMSEELGGEPKFGYVCGVMDRAELTVLLPASETTLSNTALGYTKIHWL